MLLHVVNQKSAEVSGVPWLSERLLSLLYGSVFLRFPIYHVDSGTWLPDSFLLCLGLFLMNDNFLLPSNTLRRMCMHFICFLPNLIYALFQIKYLNFGDRGSTVVKVLRYKSQGRWFDHIWCHGIFY
jgi:hypothetical protein